MAQMWKRLPTRTQNTWSYQDKDKIISGVQNIMKWGSGKTENYDPYLMAKISQSLNLVDDYAHWVSQEEIEDKYNSIPEDYKNTLKMTSQWVNAKGSMTNYELTEQAKSYGVKLSDEEKNLLQERPWIQQSYLQVKKKSANIDSRSMEAIMGTIMNDIQTWKLQNKNQLKVRLQNVLNIENVGDVDYLSEDLWADLTTNKTSNEKMDRIRTKYKELFWFSDRTGWQKTKETWMWMLNGLQEKVTNGLNWLSKATVDVGLSVGYGISKLYWADENPEWFVPADVDLWGIDENALSPETKEMVDKLRAYGLWAWVVNAMDVYYDAKRETADAKIDDFFKDASFPYKDDARDSETLRENSNYIGAWEFAWGLIPEIYVTSKIGAMLPMSAVENAPWYLKLWYRMMRSGAEWTAFEAMEEWNVDPMNVWLYVASSALVDPFFKTIWRKIERRWIKKWFWKGWDSAVESVMSQWEKNAIKNAEEQALRQSGKDVLSAEEKQVIRDIESKGINTTRADAEKYVVETVANALPNEFNIVGASNVLDTSAKYVETAISWISNDISWMLGSVPKKYKNTYVNEMLEKVFSQSKNDVSEAYSVFRNAKIWAWMSEEAVAEEWKMMEKLYKDWASEFSLVEQEKVKENMRIIHDTYSKSQSHKPLWGLEPAWWRDQQISAQNLIKWYAEENWIKELSDLYLQQSVLIRAKEWFEANASKSMMDIINRYAWRTLVWGIGGYVASQTIWEWPLSNPYIATASTILAMALWWSPRASLIVSKFANRMSIIEARAIINSAEDWTLNKIDKITWDWAYKSLKDVLYADSLIFLKDEIQWSSDSSQPILSTDDIDFWWNQYSSMWDDEIYDI